MLKTPEPRAVVTVCETVFHSRPGGATTSHAASYDFPAGDEQVYERELRIGTEWIPLDTGWVKTPVLIVLSSRKDAGGDVLMGHGGACPPFCVVRPGRSVRFEPVGTEPIWVKATDGVKVKLSVVEG